MKSLTEENYLKALFMLSQKNKEVLVNDLSKELDITMPTVTAMMKRFAKKGWVIYESYKPIQLSEKGFKEAALIVRKHRLTEMFLVGVMDFGWEFVHEVAEQIEHIESPMFFDKMDKMLNYPKIDPHGSPIPDKNGKIIQLDYIKLADCKPGDKAVFRAVINSTEEFLTFLNDRNLPLQTLLKIKSIEVFDQSMLVEYNDEMYTFSEKACQLILVEKIKSN